MIWRPRHLFIRFILPISWRRSEQSKVRILHEFAMTELDSAWQSLNALNFVKDRHLRKLLLRHAIEELDHSERFLGLAREAGAGSHTPVTRRSPLIDFENEEQPTLKFLAALSVGEDEIRGDFAAYQKALPEPRVKQVLSDIAIEEEGHASGCRRALVSAAAKANVPLKGLVIKEHLALTWRRYLQTGFKIGAKLMGAGLFVAYFLFAPFAVAQARKRLKG
jgi:rubrerythrin